MKRCSKCGIEKSFQMFAKDRRSPHGLSSNCKACQKLYRDANKLRALEYGEQYRAINKDKLNIHNKAYREANPGKYYQRNKAYRKANKEKVATYQREYFIKNKNAIYANISRYNGKNPKIKRAHMTVSNHVRSGRIIPLANCSKCGDGGRIEAHHHDYDKPLIIEWLCKFCHWTRHQENGPGLNGD